MQFSSAKNPTDRDGKTISQQACALSANIRTSGTNLQQQHACNDDRLPAPESAGLNRIDRLLMERIWDLNGLSVELRQAKLLDQAVRAGLGAVALSDSLPVQSWRTIKEHLHGELSQKIEDARRILLLVALDEVSEAIALPVLTRLHVARLLLENPDNNRVRARSLLDQCLSAMPALAETPWFNKLAARCTRSI